MTALLMQLQTEGALTPEQAQAAAKRVQGTGQQPEEALLALGFCSEEKVYQALSRTSRLPLCEASALHSTDEARSKIPQALSQRFPYSIYYRIVNGVVRIYAVLDNRANPDDNDNRLDASGSLHP